MLYTEDLAGHSVVSIDHSPLVSWALRRYFSENSTLKMAGSATTIRDGLELVGQLSPAVVLCNLHFKDGSGFSLLRDLRLNHPSTKVLIYTAIESDLCCRHCLQLGASGYVFMSEPLEGVAIAVSQALQGRIYVSPPLDGRLLSMLSGGERSQQGVASLSGNELEVLFQIGCGLSSAEISRRLHRSPKTVETYRSRIKRKLGTQCSTDLALFAFQYFNIGLASGVLLKQAA